MIEKAMGRRGILGLLVGAGAAAAAPQVVGVKVAAAALGVATTAAAGEIVDGAVGVGPPGSDEYWQVVNLLERVQYAKRKPLKDMPHHISSKKSWSAAFKAHEFAREEAIMQAYFDKLRKDRSLMEQIMGHLIGEERTNDPD